MKKILFSIALSSLLCTINADMNIKSNNKEDKDKILFERILEIDTRFNEVLSKKIEEKCGTTIIEKYKKEVELGNKKIKNLQDINLELNNINKEMKEKNEKLYKIYIENLEELAKLKEKKVSENNSIQIVNIQKFLKDGKNIYFVKININGKIKKIRSDKETKIGDKAFRVKNINGNNVEISIKKNGKESIVEIKK